MFGPKKFQGHMGPKNFGPKRFFGPKKFLVHLGWPTYIIIFLLDIHVYKVSDQWHY